MSSSRLGRDASMAELLRLFFLWHISSPNAAAHVKYYLVAALHSPLCVVNSPRRCEKKQVLKLFTVRLKPQEDINRSWSIGLIKCVIFCLFSLCLASPQTQSCRTKMRHGLMCCTPRPPARRHNASGGVIPRI